MGSLDLRDERTLDVMIVEISELVLRLLERPIEARRALAENVGEEVDRVAQLLDGDAQAMHHLE